MAATIRHVCVVWTDRLGVLRFSRRHPPCASMRVMCPLVVSYRKDAQARRLRNWLWEGVRWLHRTWTARRIGWPTHLTGKGPGAVDARGLVGRSICRATNRWWRRRHLRHRVMGQRLS